MRQTLAVEKEGKGTVSRGNSGWVTDGTSSISSYSHKHKSVCVLSAFVSEML